MQVIFAKSRLNIVIQGELIGVGSGPDDGDLLGKFVVDPGIDHVLGEHVPLEKELMVSTESQEHARQVGAIESFAKRQKIHIERWFSEKASGTKGISQKQTLRLGYLQQRYHLIA